ncbi:10777_t:CDS:2, partial [Diversispora eburnea]
ENDDPFHFARQFHDAFNENLTKAILPGPYLCMDESMKLHPIGCEFKALADAQINLFLRLDPAEPSEFIADSWFGSTDACISLYNYGLYSILQIKKRRYWPRNIPHDITGALEDTYGSSVSRTCKKNNGSGDVKFRRPVVFDEYNEFRSAVDILNNLRDNAFSYHDVLVSKRSVDRIFAFYFSVVEANSFSTYLTPQPRNSKANMFNTNAKVVVNVLIPVVA